MPATEIPLAAATVRGTKASVFVVEGTTARARVIPVRGEVGGKLYLDPVLADGAKIVTEGRALLSDGDAVLVALSAPSPTVSAAPADRTVKP
jgi:hypothetical protein